MFVVMQWKEWKSQSSKEIIPTIRKYSSFNDNKNLNISYFYVVELNLKIFK